MAVTTPSSATVAGGSLAGGVGWGPSSVSAGDDGSPPSAKLFPSGGQEVSDAALSWPCPLAVI